VLAPPGRGHRPAGQVALLEALIDHLGLAPVLLVGNCMGSNSAAGIAARRAGDVAGLVLVNPLTEATFWAGRLGPLHGMARLAPGPTRAARRVARRIVPPGPAARAAVHFQVGRKGRGSPRSGVWTDRAERPLGRGPSALGPRPHPADDKEQKDRDRSEDRAWVH
jgi:pimeloyl-ACP methyl ester carboxylesterase